MKIDYSSAKHEQHKHPKIYFSQYLYNSGEPSEGMYGYTRAELDAELLEDNYDMKHRVRRIAQQLRDNR